MKKFVEFLTAHWGLVLFTIAITLFATAALLIWQPVLLLTIIRYVTAVVSIILGFRLIIALVRYLAR